MPRRLGANNALGQPSLISALGTATGTAQVRHDAPAYSIAFSPDSSQVLLFEL